MSAPLTSIPVAKQLKDPTDFLAVVVFLMTISDYVIRKTWCSPIEAWVLRQFVMNFEAYADFHHHLDSGMECLHSVTNCYYSSFQDFHDTIMNLFFLNHTDILITIEMSIRRIKLTMNGEEGPANPKSLIAFTNILRKLFQQADGTCPYSERHQIARIRILLPFFVHNYLNESELRNGSPI